MILVLLAVLGILIIVLIYLGKEHRNKKEVMEVYNSIIEKNIFSIIDNTIDNSNPLEFGNITGYYDYIIDSIISTIKDMMKSYNINIDINKYISDIDINRDIECNVDNKILDILLEKQELAFKEFNNKLIKEDTKESKVAEAYENNKANIPDKYTYHGEYDKSEYDIAREEFKGTNTKEDSVYEIIDE